jgi:DNA replication and repair protein RecF
MRLEKLSLYNFKNYREAQLEFNGNIQCFLGKNGSGKTNLLDAIYYLSFTKSAINSSDQQAIRTGENHFLIKGELTTKAQRHRVTCSFEEGQKKIIREDDEECGRLSTHIGKYPVVLVAPNDIELIWDGSEMRRRFFDSLLSQTDKTYLENLITYGRFLKQRNSLLRIFFERGTIDQDMLEVYDEKLVPAGEYIYRKRKDFMEEFLSLFDRYYRFLAGDEEKVQITYESQLHDVDFAQVLRQNLQRDILLQRTGAGVHRDDFLFSINDGELKRLGSQGQQKSFLIALKLAEFQVVFQNKGMKPLLLLDDIFDKLDDERIRKLMLLVVDGTFGQLLITDARAGRSLELLKESNVKAEFFQVESGNLKRIHEKTQNR